MDGHSKRLWGKKAGYYLNPELTVKLCKTFTYYIHLIYGLLRYRNWHLEKSTDIFIAQNYTLNALKWRNKIKNILVRHQHYYLNGDLDNTSHGRISMKLLPMHVIIFRRDETCFYFS